jgi:hypothetical protein
MNENCDKETVYGAPGRRKKSACGRDSVDSIESNESLFELDRMLRKRPHSDSSSIDNDYPLGRSAAGVRKIVSNGGRSYESEESCHGDERGSADDGEQIAGDTSMDYFRAESSRNYNRGSLQKTEGRSEEVCNSSRQANIAGTIEVCDDGAASLLISAEAVTRLTAVLMETQ